MFGAASAVARDALTAGLDVTVTVTVTAAVAGVPVTGIAVLTVAALRHIPAAGRAADEE
ncbi:hypothetical protein ABT352_15045 [Streptosporangium sp. NPDC000563]|uniref:hypothetical protein n=1 Tax=Streptosporangium sp. NPDC000563 TaxID=3154366 RepID=UPI0033254CA5